MGPCVTTMRWILKHKTHSWPAIHLSRPSLSLGNKKQVHFAHLSLKMSEAAIAERKHCWTNATGTTTDTINTAVVPLTMSLVWHSSRVWCCWKKNKKAQWCSFSLLSKPYSQGLQENKSSEGPDWAQCRSRIPTLFSRLCQTESLLIRQSVAQSVFTASYGQ